MLQRIGKYTQFKKENNSRANCCPGGVKMLNQLRRLQSAKFKLQNAVAKTNKW